GCGRGRRNLGVHAYALAHRAYRRDPVVQPHVAQRVVVATAQHDAMSVEACVVAHFPAAAVDDDRRRAIVESDAFHVADSAVCRDGSTSKSFTFVERDARDCLRRDGDAGDGEGMAELAVHVSLLHGYGRATVSRALLLDRARGEALGSRNLLIRL